MRMQPSKARVLAYKIMRRWTGQQQTGQPLRRLFSYMHLQYNSWPTKEKCIVTSHIIKEGWLGCRPDPVSSKNVPQTLALLVDAVEKAQTE